jgi:hypothetical protein
VQVQDVPAVQHRLPHRLMLAEHQRPHATQRLVSSGQLKRPASRRSRCNTGGWVRTQHTVMHRSKYVAPVLVCA